MSAMVLTCSVPLVLDLANQLWYCPTHASMSLTLAEHGVDAAGIAAVASWGIGVVLSMWLLGYGIRAGIDVIRRV